MPPLSLFYIPSVLVLPSHAVSVAVSERSPSGWRLLSRMGVTHQSPLFLHVAYILQAAL